MLAFDRRRAFGPWFIIGILAYLAMYFNSIGYIYIEPSGDALITFSMSGASGMVTYIMPLFAALPLAAGFCADWSSGFTGFAVMRSGKRKYIVSKIAGCAVSGGLVAAIATLILIILLVIKFPHTEEVIENFIVTGEYYDILSPEGGFTIFLCYAGAVVMQFLAGSMWAMTGLAFSAFCPNFLLTLCIPLAAYRLCLEVFYWTKLPEWACPVLLQDLLVGLGYWQTLIAGVCVFTALNLILGLIFALRVGRRLKYAQ